MDDIIQNLNDLAINNDEQMEMDDNLSHNLASILASSKHFEPDYIKTVEDLFNNGPEYGLFDNFFPSDAIDSLTMDYGNDPLLATMKFNAYAHVMYIEEIVRSSTPLIDGTSPTVTYVKINSMTLKFNLPHPDFTLNTASCIFCLTNDLHGNGVFYVMDGQAKIVDGKLLLTVQNRDIPPLKSSDKYTVFEKPFENNFENWQHMIQTIRNDRTVSRKVFGPFEMTPIDRFLEMRKSKRDTILDMVEDFFNDEQKDALFSMLFQDSKYAFVLFGPPGTGKTTTLVEAIRVIIQNPRMPARGKPRFLICTPSNSAADAFALALIKRNFLPKTSIFRAIASRYDEEARDPRIEEITMKDDRGFYSFPANKKGFEGYQVVISTIGFCPNLKLAGRKYFSHIIIDEAGQCLEPETFIPLSFFASENTNVILAGDPHQLGPVVTSNFLNDERFGMTSSLVRLSQQLEYRADDRLMVQLKNNHRSHKFIVDMASYMFYNNTLRPTYPCGHDSLCESPILEGSKIPVRFVCVYGQEVDATPSYYNVAEIEAVESYVKECLKPQYSLDPADIGIVCPYRENVRRLQARFRKYPQMTIDTVERFQGSERRIIIMTTVRTKSLGFLNEYRRFNTAITRAKHMLIVIGNPDILLQDETWKIFLYHLYFNDCFDPNTNDPEMLEYWHNYFTSIGYA